MVNDRGQLYTIEGVAAALIMLFTAYLVLSATSVYTPGDTHISDMQLEQLGTDALRIMNTPANETTESVLKDSVEHYDTTGPVEFNRVFLNYVNNKTGSLIDNSPNGLHYNATISYYYSDEINNVHITKNLPFASNGNLTGGEHPVRVTEWVIADRTFPGSGDNPRAVLVEVLLWRD